MGFNTLTCMYGAVLALRLGRHHGLFSWKPANYLMLGYEPHPSNETVVVKTQQISTWFAPALHKSYALNDRDGAYRLELARLARALSRYAAGTKLIEWGHKTSFAYITEKGMRGSRVSWKISVENSRRSWGRCGDV